MQDDIQVLFGTESIYVFMRLYILLVTMLYQGKDIIDKNSSNTISQMENPSKEDVYSRVLSSIKDVVNGKISATEFETLCRGLVGMEVHNFVAIPPLIKKCAEEALKVVQEGFLPNLYQLTQLKLKDVEQVRSFSLDVTEDAIYRLQIQSSASQVFFSFLPVDVELIVTNPRDAKPHETTNDSTKHMETDDQEAGKDVTVAETTKPMEDNPEPEQKRLKTDVSTDDKMDTEECGNIKPPAGV